MMIVYLFRHGEAVGEEEDPSRPLTEPGRKKIRDLAGILAERFRMIPGYILHSPKLRAAQTASLLSEVLPRSPKPEETGDLGPMDDPGLWARRLETMDRDVVLVGHLPHLSRLASLLLLWDPGRDILDFTPGAMVCLEKKGAWRIRWMVSPDTLKSPQ